MRSADTGTQSSSPAISRHGYPLIATRTTRETQPPVRVRGRGVDQIYTAEDMGYAAMLRLAEQQEREFALRPSFDA